MESKRTVGEPHEDLTRLANEVIKDVLNKPGTEDVRSVVCLFRTTGEGEDLRHLCGIGLNGYEDDAEAIAELLSALKTLFHAQGVQMGFLTV